MSDSFDKFRQAIESAGMTPPDTIVDDGKIHRFSTNGKPTHKSGWYLLHTDAVAAGAFGDCPPCQNDLLHLPLLV